MDPDLKDLIDFIAKALVDDPKNVSVDSIETETSVIIELKVDKSDVGKVIGKGGQTASALRKILHAAATKQKKTSLLKILE
ncbi:MAG: KH domain-containing protein [Sumerlaeia bacterium]